MGTRLGAYTAELPKCMLTFLGKSLIERQVATLRSAGVTDIAIVRGYHPEKIAIEGITYFENRDYATTNMVATFIEARAWLLSRSDDVLICYADIIYEERVIKTLLAAQGVVSVVADQDWLPYWQARLEDWHNDVESLQFTPQGKITELGTPHCTVELCNARYVGLIKLSQEGLRAFIAAYDSNYINHWHIKAPWKKSKSFRNAYMTCMIQELIDNGIDVRVALIERGWMEFDTVEDYEKAVSWAENGTLSRFIEIKD
jgi:choline kinase